MPRVILVGHSLGTPLAVLAALRSRMHGAARVEALVLSNSERREHARSQRADKLVERIRTEWGQT